jgi:peptidoglycan/xylan/chitin deacetylase (PgdA/CDA1 family)
MKKYAFKIIRGAHHKFMQKELPFKVAIYLHAVEDSQIPLVIDVLSFFADRNYRVVNAETFVNEEEKCLFVSFDDNYYSWLKVIEELNKRSFSATFYINTAPLRDLSDRVSIENYFDRIRHGGTRETLSSMELKLIVQAGCTVGGHTHSHLNLATILPADAISEILTNKMILEEYTNNEVTDFSYPFGMRRYLPGYLRTSLIDMGFKTIANAIPGQLFRPQRHTNIYRSLWNLSLPFQENIDNISIDGRFFESLTGLSPIG